MQLTDTRFVRRLGRTETMLEAALAASIDGNVVVVAANRQQARDLARRLKQLGCRPRCELHLRSPYSSNIEVVLPSRISRNGPGDDDFRLLGSSAKVFVDHFVFEQGAL